MVIFTVISRRTQTCHLWGIEVQNLWKFIYIFINIYIFASCGFCWKSMLLLEPRKTADPITYFFLKPKLLFLIGWNIEWNLTDASKTGPWLRKSLACKNFRKVVKLVTRKVGPTFRLEGTQRNFYALSSEESDLGLSRIRYFLASYAALGVTGGVTWHERRQKAEEAL